MKDLDFNAVLRDFQYKPNFGYGAYEREGHWWIRIVMYVEDSRQPFRRWELKPTDQEERYYYMDMMRLPPISNSVGYSPSREMIEVVGNYVIPYFEPGDELLFIQWMVRTLQVMEMHELDEWARYKGELLSDPHKEN